MLSANSTFHTKYRISYFLFYLDPGK